MPILVHVVTAWLAGLFTAAQLAPSYASHAPWLLALAALLVCVARLAPDALVARASLVAAVGTMGVVVGTLHASTSARCLAQLLRADTPLEVALDSRATDHGFVRGEARSGQCTAPATVKVTTGHAAAGTIATFHGKRTARGQSVDLEGTLTPTRQRDALRAWRGNAGETIDTLFGPRAPLARALLIADQAGIDPTVRDRFADAGLIHILSISGLHVALIAGALTVVAGALRMSATGASLTSLIVITFYVLALGAPAPAVRSAVMLATTVLVTRLQRPVHPWTALALGATLPTIRPDVILDLGWQLSVAGMASLVAARATMRRLRNSTPPLPARTAAPWTRARQRVARAIVRWLQRLEGWRWSLTRELFTGIVASVVTAPIIAWYFGRISVIAPVSNLFAEPVIVFLQPALFLALTLGHWRAIAQVAADACTPPLEALDAIATRAAAVPHASLHVAPTLATAVLLGLASAAFVRATAARWPTRFVLVAVSAIALAVWVPLFTHGDGQLELHMIDVGQGDAIALRTPHGKWILIDAGRSWNGGDAGRRAVVPYVQHFGGDVLAFIMSHPHDDHVGGATSVLVALHPASWWESAYVGTSPTYRQALVEVEAEQIPWHRTHPGDTLRIDGVLLRTLAPDSTWTAAQTDPNLASVVVAVEYGQSRWLFTGDAEVEEEQWLVDHWGSALRASVLKAGHHGSRTSSSGPFLDAVNPTLALVSVGADNKYGHPSPSTLAAFAARNIRVLRTDREGSIVVRTDGVTETVESRSGTWALPAR